MEFHEDLQQVLKTLNAGGLILYPTDTIWGIGCDATNAEAVDKIYRLKQRANEKAMIVLLGDIQELPLYVSNIDTGLFSYLEQVQKPTTVIYEGAKGLAQNLLASDGSVGIRITSEPFLKALIQEFKKPIVSTSANISGEPSPTNFATVSESIRSAVDYVVQYRQNDTSTSSPSAVVKWSSNNIEILRP